MKTISLQEVERKYDDRMGYEMILAPVVVGLLRPLEEGLLCILNFITHLLITNSGY